MNTFSYVDIYATKGFEYLVIIAFLISSVFFQKYFVLRQGTASRKSLFAFLNLKPYFSEMRWNPVMAYMKHPEDEAQDKNEEKKGQ